MQGLRAPEDYESYKYDPTDIDSYISYAPRDLAGSLVESTGWCRQCSVLRILQLCVNARSFSIDVQSTDDQYEAWPESSRLEKEFDSIRLPALESLTITSSVTYLDDDNVEQVDEDADHAYPAVQCLLKRQLPQLQSLTLNYTGFSVEIDSTQPSRLRTLCLRHDEAFADLSTILAYAADTLEFVRISAPQLATADAFQHLHRLKRLDLSGVKDTSNQPFSGLDVLQVLKVNAGYELPSILRRLSSRWTMLAPLPRLIADSLGASISIDHGLPALVAQITSRLVTKTTIIGVLGQLAPERGYNTPGPQETRDNLIKSVLHAEYSLRTTLEAIVSFADMCSVRIEFLGWQNGVASMASESLSAEGRRHAHPDHDPSLTGSTGCTGADIDLAGPRFLS